MTVIRVVPLQRLPPQHRWFDYVWVAADPPVVGQLVLVPFGRSEIQGLIWGVDPDGKIGALKKILRVLTDTPVVTAWQQLIVQCIADHGHVSHSTAIMSVLPTSRFDFSGTITTAPKKKIPVPPAPETVWWYHDRSEVIDRLATWLEKTSGPRLLIVPTTEDGQDVMREAARRKHTVSFVHGQMKPAEYRQIYTDILHGQTVSVIGTAKAMTLPFSVPPSIMIDQEEHPAHRQQFRHPRIDPRFILNAANIPCSITTSAPSLWWWNQHPASPPEWPEHRQLGVMNEPGLRPWISSKLETLIEESVHGGRRLTVIVPRQGFAHALRCLDCHTAVRCKHCGEYLRLFQRPEGLALCAQCNHLMPVPVTCAGCHGSRLRFQGLGPERFAQELRTLWPTAKVVLEPTHDFHILVQTYKVYHWLSQAEPSNVAVISGDSLLNNPDFAASERAWQFLHRLAAAQPHSTILVQTYVPEHDFWQRWVRADDRAFYSHELAERQRLLVPPATRQWIARHNGLVSKQDIAKKTEALDALHLDAHLMEPQPSLGQKTMVKILITLDPASALSPNKINWLEIFPHPWQLEEDIQSWND